MRDRRITLFPLVLSALPMAPPDNWLGGRSRRQPSKQDSLPGYVKEGRNRGCDMTPVPSRQQRRYAERQEAKRQRANARVA